MLCCRNWLRDYSQAMDTGTLAKAQPETIRILVWVLSLLSFGYATAEFEVTAERLGVYRPEEHIDKFVQSPVRWRPSLTII
jgi:Heterokaryon incompatibility protein Het-C